MSYEDFRKKEEKFNKEDERERKYSKKAIFGGIIGMTLSGLDIYFSNKIGIDSFYKIISDMNISELLPTTLFGLSSMATIGGGTIYGVSYILEIDSKQEPQNKIKNLEDNLEE